ncbi:MAG TPA: DUF4384 domain-containing protein [Vicinamibacterales bacterium]|nr:DUF4384 domain-containing protein [Vicinamibacterales bacterium]
MKPVDYDVYVCSGASSVDDLAARLSAGLARRGFKVFPRDAAAGEAPHSPQLEAIAGTPDFVLVLPPDGLHGLPSAESPLRAQVVEALDTGRHVVLVTPGPTKGAVSTPALPPELAPLGAIAPVAYNPARHKESIALLGHRLSSETGVAERRLMRGFRVVFAAALAVVLLGFSLQAGPALIERLTRPKPKPALPPFALYWSVALDGQWDRPAAPRDDPPVLAVEDGGRLRLAFSPSADGFAYVVSRDARGDVRVLFPNEVLAGASAVRAGVLYHAPVGGGWLEIDGRARPETIHLVAGYDPLQNLEELLERPEAELPAPARRELIDSTMSGLLDGRHAPVHRAWTRSFQRIDPRLPIGPGPGAAAASPVSDRSAAASPAPGGLATQVGHISVAVELTLVRPAAGGRHP